MDPQAQVISIVDDDASLRRSLTNLLSSLGFEVGAFASAEAFLDPSQRESTGCVVLDLRMDGMSGLELLRHLVVTGSQVPVIVLTAHGDAVARQRALQAGAVAFFEGLSMVRPSSKPQKHRWMEAIPDVCVASQKVVAVQPTTTQAHNLRRAKVHVMCKCPR